MVLTELVRLFDWFFEINHCLRFYCTVDWSSPFNCTVSGILLQQPIAPLEGIFAHFLNIYCTILKEMRGKEMFDLPG